MDKEDWQLPYAEDYIYKYIIVGTVDVVVPVFVGGNNLVEIEELSAEETFEKNIAVVCSFPKVGVGGEEKRRHRRKGKEHNITDIEIVWNCQSGFLCLF